MKLFMMRKNVLSGILLIALAAMMVGTASAKSLYVIADINAIPTPIEAYDIQGAPNYLVFQTTTGVPRFGWGGVGLAIDNVSAKLFVTYEQSNTIQLLDATNFADLGTTTAPGATNLAGIAVDQGKNKVYTVDRVTNNLYVYSWDSSTNKLTLDGGAAVQLTGVTQAYGLALDEKRGRLFVGDANTTTVLYYDTGSLASSPVAAAGSVDLSAEGQTVMGIAVDSQRNLLYTGNAYGPFGSLGKLVKYDLNTATISAYTLPGAPVSGSYIGDNIIGVAVDEDTGNVYVTTGNQGSGGTDTLIVFDSDLTVLKNDIGDIGNPTGIAIGRTSINPLNLTKTDNPDPVETGANLTYTICFDNEDNTLDVDNVTLVDQLPAETTFVSATGGGVYASVPHTVTWNEGTVAAGATQVCHDLVVTVNALPNTTILNRVTIDSDDTPPTTQTEDTTVIDVQVQYVAFDIKPQSCPNPLNVLSGGVIPVAILGTEDLDVTQIDPTSVKLEGVSPMRWSVEDVATPFEPFTGKQDAYDCTIEGPDGYLDLTMKFKKQELIDAIGDVNDGDVLVLTVSGQLLDGTAIEGEDVVVILK